MTKQLTTNQSFDDELRQMLQPRRFVDASWRLELANLSEPLLISDELNRRLFGNAKHRDVVEVFEDPEYPCPELAERFADSALILSTAFAATERHSPVSVEIPTIEGLTTEKTRVKVFRFRDGPDRDGFLMLLDDEPDPTSLEFAELEADAYCSDLADDWDDV